MLWFTPPHGHQQSIHNQFFDQRGFHGPTHNLTCEQIHNHGCNSLHTNAFDEAITTPTEESVRRAVAIQMIINKELGLNFCENPWQGSFIVMN